MIPQEIKESTPLIAEFLGYKYYKKVLVDFSDCGGIYDWTDVYSKIPIEIDDYPEEEQCYFKNNWCRYNYSNYIFNPTYHEDWNQLMNVVEKIEMLNYAVRITQNICQIQAVIMGDRTIVTTQTGNYKEANTKLSNTYKAVVEFIKWYKTKNSEK